MESSNHIRLNFVSMASVQAQLNRQRARERDARPINPKIPMTEARAAAMVSDILRWRKGKALRKAMAALCSHPDPLVRLAAISRMGVAV